MSKPLIVIDLDGVCAEVTYHFMQMAHEVSEGASSRPLSAGKKKIWNFAEHISNKIITKTWEVIDEHPTFWRDLPLLVTEPELNELRYLANHVEVMYLTGREGENAFNQTVNWLAEHGFPQFFNLHLSPEKHDFLHEFGHKPLDIIDDKPKNIIELTDAGFLATVRDWPYNRELDQKYPRVYSLGEWMGTIEERLG